MKLKILFINFVFFQKLLFAQSYLDFEYASSIDQKAEIGNLLWNDYMRNDLDSLLLIGRKLYFESNEAKHLFGKAVAEKCIGTALSRKGQKKGIYYLNNANFYFELKEWYDLSAETLNEIGVYYQQKGNVPLAQKYYLKANARGEFGEDESNAYISTLNLAQSFLSINELEKAHFFAMRYKNQALKSRKYEAVSNALAVLGSISQLNHQTNLASYYYKESFVYAKRSKSIIYIAHAATNRALYDLQNNIMDSVVFYLNKALYLHNGSKNLKNTSNAYYNLGVYYEDIEADKIRAASYYQEAWEILKNTTWYDDREEIINAMLHLGLESDSKWKAATLQNRQLKIQAEKEDHEIQQIFEESSIFNRPSVQSETFPNWLYLLVIGVLFFLGVFVLQLKLK